MAYVNGGMGVLPAGSTVVGSLLNSTGFDRLLLIHIGTLTQQTVAFWKLGASLTAYTTSLVVASNDVRDFGPFFFGSTESLFGGGVTSSSGFYVIDELRS